MGFGLGAITGTVSGLKFARDNNLNPWTGKSNSTAGSASQTTDISRGRLEKKQYRTNVSGDYEKVQSEWNNVQRQFGVEPTQRIPDGFERTLPNGHLVRGQFYQGGGTNPAGYTIKVDYHSPAPTINKIPPIHIRYD